MKREVAFVAVKTRFVWVMIPVGLAPLARVATATTDE